MVELRGRAVRTLDRYDSVLWLHDVPHHPLCRRIDWSLGTQEETSEVWLEVLKPNLTAPPPVPVSLMPWVDSDKLKDSSRDGPSLRERIPAGSSESREGEYQPFLLLNEHPEITASWVRYLEDKWKPWAEKDRALRPVQKVYNALFSIYQKQKKLGEAFDVVLGLGLLQWTTPSNQEIRRHLVTGQASLTFDAERGVLSVGPAGEGANLRLEQDMLDPQYRPAASEQASAEMRLKERGDDLGDLSELSGILKQWAHALAPDAEVETSLTASTGHTSHPRVTLAPALILRERTERSLLRLMEEILAKVEAGEPIPQGVERLVEIVDDPGPGEGEPNESESVRGPSEVYFPLPANEEQLEIVERLATHQGVLVQGPPGTGKSHTIANLVSHLLATGQRILVTSHTARALKVLKDKIPEQVADLCVQLLGNDLEALESLESSVRGITDRYHGWSKSRHEARVLELTEKLRKAREQEAKALGELRAIREAETYRHPRRFDSYEGTAQATATRLRAEELSLGWIPSIRNADADPPLTNDETGDLLSLLRRIEPKQEAELRKAFPNSASVPEPDRFADSVEREAEARNAAERQLSNRALAEILAALPRETLAGLRDGIRTLDRALEPLLCSTERWIQDAVQQCLEGRTASWRQLLSTTTQHLSKAGSTVSRVSDLRISGLPERDRIQIRTEAQTLLKHLESGGSLGFWIFRPGAIRPSLYLATHVRVDGRLCDTPRQLKVLIDWIDVAENLYALKRAWASRGRPASGSLSEQSAYFTDLRTLLERTVGLTAIVDSLNTQIGAISGVATPVWHDPKSLSEVRDTITWALLRHDFVDAKALFDPLERDLARDAARTDSHPIAVKLRDAVRKRDVQGYREQCAQLKQFEAQRQDLQRRDQLFERLRKEAPELAKDLRTHASDAVWDERIARFTDAWNWARADAWLKRLNDPESPHRLSSQIDAHRKAIGSLLADLGAEKAWAHCFARMTEHERQHLEAWKMAMSRIGKGTGKYASRHRRAAREHMEECRSAIPAWILPVYRVAETVRATRDLFDVAIIDEASQSGVEALFLHYLARQVVVVGDDKQISPEFVGINREDVDALRQKHIRDLPHNDAYGVENSFFEQAAIRYPGRIRLREHFRCMPEIIQFSNNLCYASEPLIPLRQYGTGRLTPVVVTRHIETGYQEGRSPRIVNPPEADAIVKQIVSCCNDPAYEGKTMGVISLLGRDQSELISTKLLEPDALGAERVDQRQLVCGDAYAFQGDERDVMFLTLVSAPGEGHRIGVLGTEAAKRRFNVAASRARDQMWLFHSATLNDLSRNDLRYVLLEYCLEPNVRPSSDPRIPFAELERAAARQRAGDPVPPPFDSWFEVDVFLEIARKGYRVLPQYELAGYRIDLLVEGLKGRLAVECDGDVWHGLDRYEADMTRQRMLERCGLRFWRVRGSTFYRSPDTVLKGLWEALDTARDG